MFSKEPQKKRKKERETRNMRCESVARGAVMISRHVMYNCQYFKQEQPLNTTPHISEYDIRREVNSKKYFL